MRLAVISFTGAGAKWCRHLVRHFRERGMDCVGYVQPRFLEDPQKEIPKLFPVTEPPGEWTRKQFGERDGLIYIGAAGIAVRAVAPFLRDKLRDPAVVVMDEAGNYAISLLSGHVGGANDLARAVAEICGAKPVITTASDVRGKTGIDVWAARQGLVLGERKQAKEVAAALLEEKPVGFFRDFAWEEPVPEGYLPDVAGERNVWLTVRRQPEPKEDMLGGLFREGRILRLLPRILTVGIGCRRGAAKERIQELAEKILWEANLDQRAVASLASIDRKSDEEGICLLAQEWQVPFVTFSSEELEQIPGPLSESPFVRQVTGTGNVCERAALAAAGTGGKLLVKKQAENGVTVAVAIGQQRGRRKE